jgi:hypothetical protein
MLVEQDLIRRVRVGASGRARKKIPANNTTCTGGTDMNIDESDTENIVLQHDGDGGRKPGVQSTRSGGITVLKMIVGELRAGKVVPRQLSDNTTTGAQAVQRGNPCYNISSFYRR